MPKKERGLPVEFDLAVSDETVRRAPVALEDYLEREINGDGQAGAGTGVRTPLPMELVRRSPIEAMESSVATSVEPVRDMRLKVVPERVPTFPQRFRPRQAPIKPPRVQLNMTPEVQRMVQELVGHFCAFGVQRDTSASEVFEGLVSALHEARDHLDLSEVPPRGQWGSPTARAFRTSLKNAILEALGRHRQRLAP